MSAPRVCIASHKSGKTVVRTLGVFDPGRAVGNQARQQPGTWPGGDRHGCLPPRRGAVAGREYEKPSAFSSMGTPILRSSAANTLMRSTSFTRSSPASVTVLVPAAWVAATAMIGNSSMPRTTVSPFMSAACSSSKRTRRSTAGSPPVSGAHSVSRTGRP